ncbi:MAG TPA: (d)CMP kinase [Tepidiformaceae bacterium]|nr:(d)CMP kinase [Tepidiformaceae bacterium]
MPNRPIPGLPHPIAIDGPAASGKSTVGQALAAEFGYLFLDTGLMYRAFTLAALRAGVGADDPAACEALAASLPLTARAGSETNIFLGDEDVTGELRAPEVEANVSKYSAIPGVRSAMVGRQREVAQSAPAVLAGRDIGTVVLPDAPLKIFLTASEEARAARRGEQQHQDAAQARRDISGRDASDSTRATAPLTRAADALELDTTTRPLDAVLAFVRERVAALTARSAPAPPSATAAPHAPARAAAKDGARRALAPLRRVRAWFGYGRFTPPFYWACTYLLRFILMVVGRWKATGRERVPVAGPLIVVSNHLNNADPPIVGAGIARRRIRWMAKAELYKYPIGAIPRLWGAFPVRRFDADIRAMLQAERILKNGEVLGMFPEGHRSRTGYVGRPHPGTALIALRSGATVLPCAIIGTEQLGNLWNLLKKPRISVVIGEPFTVEKVRKPSEQQVSDLTERIFEAITALLPAKYLPTYTDPGKEGNAADGGDSPGV